MKTDIDYDALSRAIRHKVGRRTQRECAKGCGIDKSTFGRLYNNTNTSSRSTAPTTHGVTSDTVYQVCRWLGLPVETFTSKGSPPLKEADTRDAIDYYLMRDPALTQSQAINLSNMIRAAYKAVASVQGGSK